MTQFWEKRGLGEPVRVEVYELIGGQYELLAANERGHYPITPLGVELGLCNRM